MKLHLHNYVVFQHKITKSPVTCFIISRSGRQGPKTTMMPQGFEKVFHAMKTGQVHPLSYISDHVKLSQVKEEFKRWLNPDNKTLNVIVEMD